MAAATIALGLPSAMVAAHAATTGPQLVFNDCAQQPTSTTTTSTSTTGNGTGCTTQAQVGVGRTLTVTYTNNGSPVQGATIDFAVDGSAFFPANQPNGNTSAPPPGKSATCVTDANGQCSVLVNDNTAETVHVTATVRGANPAVTATETVQFRANSVAPARVDETSRYVVAPENDRQNASNGGTAAGVAPDSTDATPGTNPADDGWDGSPTPGRPVQLTYTVNDQNNPSAPNCTGTGSSPSTCEGTPVAGVTLTAHVDNAAFFTPNCTEKDVSGNGTPQRNNFDATLGTSTNPGKASTGALVTPTYHNCSFTTAPADGVQTGNLTSLGQTEQVTTDANGQFTVTIAEARDAGFDDDGIVDVQPTFTSGNTTLTARNPGTTYAQNASGCTGAQGTYSTTVPNGAVTPGGQASNTNSTYTAPTGQAGCAAVVEFNTQTVPLNGVSATIVPVASGTLHQTQTQNCSFFFGCQTTTQTSGTGNSGSLAHGTTNQIPNNQFRVIVIELKDQFGNLTQDPHNNAQITKTGVGTMYECDGTSTSNDPCQSPDTDDEQGNQSNGSSSFTSNDNTQVFNTDGSYTDPDNQQRYAIDAADNSCSTNGQFGTCSSFDTGNTTIAVDWNAPVTTFWYTTTNGTTTFSGYHYLNAHKTDSVAITWYAQQPTNITLSVTPSSSVPAGTVVTTTVTVKDQQGNPVSGDQVQFIRSGPNADCSATSTPAAGQPGALTTDQNGKAGFSFTCNQASNQTVTVIVSDGNGNEIGRQNTGIAFTSGSGGTATPKLPKITSPAVSAVQLGAHRHTIAGSGQPGDPLTLYRNGSVYTHGSVSSTGHFSFRVNITHRSKIYVLDTKENKASNTVTIYVKVQISLDCTSPAPHELKCHLHTNPRLPHDTVSYRVTFRNTTKAFTFAGETNRRGNDTLIQKGLPSGHARILARVSAKRAVRHNSKATETRIQS